MSTWQIIAAGDSFRWEISAPVVDPEPDSEPIAASSSLLPSMPELLLQGYSKLSEEKNEGGFGRTPMFKTGLGRSVPIKQSSIAKAMSVLGSDCKDNAGKLGQSFNAQVCVETPVKQSSISRGFSVLEDDYNDFAVPKKARDNGCDFSNSLFQTGSGKLVNVSSDGLARAKALLGLNEDNNDSCNFQGFQNSKALPNGDLHFGPRADFNQFGPMDNASVPRSLPALSTDLGQNRLTNEAKPIQSRIQDSTTKPPPVKFSTAGGRSISVSSDALKRAKSLLGDPDLGGLFDSDGTDFSFSNAIMDSSLIKENDPLASLSSHQEMGKNTIMSKSFVSPLRSSSKKIPDSVNSESLHSGTNLIRKFDAVSHHDDDVYNKNGKITYQQQCSSNGLVENSSANDISLRKNLIGKSIRGQLVDISNTLGTTGEKRRTLGNSVSPFKKPRNSKFLTPMKSNVSLAPNGFSTFSSERSCSNGRVSMRYPFQATRLYIKEYFSAPPSENSVSKSVSHQFRWIRPDNAEEYKFVDDSGVRCIGVEAFFNMLVHSGASDQYASKEWVKNHFKWIVWKLACYERYYPTKSAGNFLTVSNVLEELKYRYEREVNHGHRSAIKRILEGDASPTLMMVLCVSAICSNNDPKTEVSPSTLLDAKNHSATMAKVELTDGWYSVDALLDVLLLKQLASGKLFVGQKLRIWGAGLSGWVGPVSPLEVSRTISLVLHMNGTYRVHWADRLGFCKGFGPPLAFKCIKSNGGAVPMTLVGITRVYPILYKERLKAGRSVVRSERMESKVMQSYNQRRSIIIESIESDFQRGIKHQNSYNDSDSEEGAKILKLLEKASEPEVLLAEMSPDQISSFTKYQAKMQEIRHSDMEKAIEKALENAGLDKREVNPFMRVKVVGLTSKSNQGKENPKVGLITIWNPTEKQQSILAEGKAYNVAGLLPTSTGIETETIFLQARESTTWKQLSPQAMEHFKPFFTPRKSAQLLNLGEVSLSSEFDIAAFVVFVGDVHKFGHQKKQWVFVTDGSVSELYSKQLSDCLLAICFCSPNMDDDSFVPFNRNLVGSTVGFCDIIKRAKDQMNHIWVAEASENSTHFLNFDMTPSSHLKEAFVSAERWGKVSQPIIAKLKEKVLFIIGDCKS